MGEESCCFIGHRKIENTEQVKEKLTEVVGGLPEQGVTIFYFGSRSAFDTLAWEVVSQFKEKHQAIKRIYVRSDYAYVREEYKEYLLESYEDTYMPNGVENAGKAAYVKRNQFMIEVSDICVFYCKEDYMIARRKRAKRDVIDYQPKSGTKIAYAYAVNKKKNIINIVGTL